MTKTKMTDEQRKEARRLASKKWYAAHKKAKTVYGTTPEAAAKIAKSVAKHGRPAKKIDKKATKKAAKLAVMKAKLADLAVAEKAAWDDFKAVEKTYRKLNNAWVKVRDRYNHLKARIKNMQMD